MKQKSRVLIVDDYQKNILALSELIASDRIEIVSANSGPEALERMLEHDFALALLDVEMREMTGFELARLIRGVKRYRHLPIIFVTAHQFDQSYIFEGYDTGAVDLLFKPLDPYVVRSKVNIFVEMNEQQRLLETQVQELNQLRRAANAANVAKSQFLANMSHEIRTPLAAILGYSQFLTQENLPREEREKMSQTIRKNGDLLLCIIDDILDFSKIEANRLELDNGEVEITELLNDIKATMSFKAKEKGIALDFNLKGEPEKVFVGDTLRIKQVILNIVGNAIKFTKRGRVDFEATLNDLEDSQYSLLTIHVRDSGIGMSEDQLSRLFQSFIQGDLSIRRQYGGTGLGLIISRRLAELMGGDVVVLESTPNVGTVFRITMKLKKSDISVAEFRSKEEPFPHDQGLVAQALNAKRILVADDSEDNLNLIELYLSGFDVQLEFAENGAVAIQKAAATKPDLVLMDIQMPIVDGFEATQEIRKQGYRSPIIALTAHALKSEGLKCLAAGCDDVLVKPIKQPQLVDKLARYLHRPLGIGKGVNSPTVVE